MDQEPFEGVSAPATAENGNAEPLNIFISYRRGPDGDSARASMLHKALAERFGAQRVFMDIADIGDGEDFVARITPRLQRCNVFLAVIGPRWERVVNERDHPALFDRQDWVRMEVETALKRRPPIVIIPVLVEGAKVPDWRRLPRTMKRLVHPTNARSLRHESWDEDVASFAERLERDTPKRLLELGRAYEAAQRPVQMHSSVPSNGYARPDEDHFDEVAMWLAKGGLVTFLGPGVNASDGEEPWPDAGERLPAADELARYLAKAVGFDFPDARRLAEVSEYALLAEDDVNLHQRLEAVLQPPRPTSAHRFLARLPSRLEQLGFDHPYQVIVTSNYDDALEQAFEDQGEDFHLAVYCASGPHAGRFLHVPYDRHQATVVSEPNAYDGFGIGREFVVKDRSVIVKICGTLDNPRVEGSDSGSLAGTPPHYVLTADDHIDFMSQVPAAHVVPVEISNKLMWSRRLFIGYPIADWSTRVLLRRVWANQRPLEGWAIDSQPVRDRDRWRLDRKLWREFRVESHSMPLVEYTTAIDAALQARAAPGAPE